MLKNLPAQLTLELTTPEADVEQFDAPDGNAFQAAKAAARADAAAQPVAGRVVYARGFCAAVLRRYWELMCARQHCSLPIQPLDLTPALPQPDAGALVEELAQMLVLHPTHQAAYLMGTLYTTTLPNELRAELGAYYTPPGLVTRLLDMATEAGFDWRKGRVIDPACGGGAFLAPVALRMWQALEEAGAASALDKLTNITARLRGIEIDVFAAWMAEVLLEIALLPLCVAANQRVSTVVRVEDALALTEESAYDLVIGNPPYGRLTLAPSLRAQYNRSLFGHANLYGVFTDLAVRLVAEGGIIAYVTPTSFLGGQYFKALRNLLAEVAPPYSMDFVTDREGVFDDVLQEMLLAVYKKGPRADRLAAVHFLQPADDGNSVSVEPVGRYAVARGEEPWLLPREHSQAALFKQILKMRARLANYGYSVSTGPLVWNRHKTQLRVDPDRTGTLPLIWAESVLPNRFHFSAARRNHVPYICLHDNQNFLITNRSCILVQRTTAKEQQRRLIAAVLPQSFLDQHGGVVVENHLNMVRANGQARVKLETVCALLNTKVVDCAFRCISGSVAVSAYELNALPMPDVDQMQKLEHILTTGATNAEVESLVASFYGVRE